MQPLVEVKNITKEFNGFTAIEKISFSAYKGQICGLLGPNGAGKTTTIRIIATLLQPSQGTAELAGFDILRQPEQVRKKIGVLTTEVGVYDRFTGKENLEYFGQLYGLDKENLEARVGELVQMLEMQDFINRKAGQYSTGMKQKLAISRAIIHNPEIMILDEPTAGLDVLSSQTVVNFMQKAKEQGKCVIFSTHNMFKAQKLCDKVVIIHQGKLVADDLPGNLYQKTGTDNLEDVFLKLVLK